jgi:hypothetical protein
MWIVIELQTRPMGGYVRECKHCMRIAPRPHAIPAAVCVCVCPCVCFICFSLDVHRRAAGCSMSDTFCDGSCGEERVAQAVEEVWVYGTHGLCQRALLCH